MKERETFPGRAYAVTTQSGCNVYADEAGTQLIKTVEAGQGYFVAIGSRTWVDDDAAIVTETFNGAARKLRLLAGGVKEKLPAGYTQLEYLESDGSQVVQTGLLARSYNTRFKIKFNDLRTSDTPRMVVFGFWSNKTNECSYTCADDDIGYLQIQMNQYGRVRKIDRNYTLDCKKSKGVIPEVIYNGQKVAYLDNIPEYALTNVYQNPISLFGFTVNDGPRPMFIGQLFYFELYVDGVKIGHLIPCLDRTGAPCMYDLVRRTPYYNVGSGDFTYPSPSGAASYSLRRPVAEWGKLTPHGVRRLYKLPDNYTGEPEQYINENRFKRLVENDMPEEGYWTPEWRETDTELILEWREIEPPAELENTPEILTDTTQQ